MSIESQILSILNNSKKVMELPIAATLVGTYWMIMWNTDLNRLERIPVSAINNGAGWIWIEGSHVEKDSGNFDITALEAGDIVWFKPITNGGDPLTLEGYTYDGGDSQLIANYTQNQAITT